MKHFYYIITNSKRRTNGGKHEDVKIYMCKGNKIVHCCDWDWNTSGYKGEKHEVFTALIENGFIPRKWYKSSVCAWRSAGYFAGEVLNHYTIEEL